ncbi:T9SS type A sorting domain-containing protein [Candidatus Fermentibacteria bacterium]|nr:T9SS type A sorting domain-containing protein [Candidatus Fermentibacteria bacterium]
MLRIMAVALAVVVALSEASDYRSVIVGPIDRDGVAGLVSEGFDLERFDHHYARFYVDDAQLNRLRALGYSPMVEPVPEPLEPYPSLSEIFASMDAVVSAHPDICRHEYIGTTVEGRDIRAVVVSDNVGQEEVEPELRIQSTIHGDEPVAATTTMHFLETLTDHYPDSPTCQYVVDTAELWVIPVLNADGYVDGSRYNANGIDLNRNCSYMGPGGGGGSTAFSEPETQSLRDVTMKSWPEIENFENNFATGLSLHSGAQCVNTVWNYTEDPLPEDYDLLENQGESYIYDPEILDYYEGDFILWLPGASWYVTNGDVNDWSYGECGTVDYTIELSHTKAPSNWPDYDHANYHAMLDFMVTSCYGIYGTVKNNLGNPLDARIEVSIPSDDGFDSQPLRFCRTDVTMGDYHKTLLPGTYDVKATVDGYAPQTVEGVTLGAEERVEVSFVFGTGVPRSGAAMRGRGSRLAVYPNPARSYCSITLPSQGVEGKLEIYDIYGRLIESVDVQSSVASVQWDCRNSTGSPLSPGAYLVRFRTDGESYSTRLIVSD